MKCTKCGGDDVVAVKEKSALTLLGILGATVFLAGVGSCLLNPLVGGIVALVGLAMGAAGNRERDFLKCPNCRFKRAF